VRGLDLDGLSPISLNRRFKDLRAINTNRERLQRRDVERVEGRGIARTPRPVENEFGTGRIWAADRAVVSARSPRRFRGGREASSSEEKTTPPASARIRPSVFWPAPVGAIKSAERSSWALVSSARLMIRRGDTARGPAKPSAKHFRQKLKQGYLIRLVFTRREG